MSNQTPEDLGEHIRNFVFIFHEGVKTKNLSSLTTVYRETWNKVSDAYFKQSEWPSIEQISPLVSDDEPSKTLFLHLYAELYFRHLYSRLHNQLSTDHRFNAWNNYKALFDFILDPQNESILPELPTLWLWSMVDEFIYQFQEFCQHRYQAKNAEDIKKLRDNTEPWNVQAVLTYLQSFVTIGKVGPWLSGGTKPEGIPQVQMYLGFFSVVGQLRIHCLLGDYYMALKSVEDLDLNKRSLFTSVTQCHVTLYYYLGFAYLLSHRFVDAIKTFTNVLQYISRINNKQSRFANGDRGFQSNVVSKMEQQMYCALSIAIAFSPRRIDDTVDSNLRDRYGEKIIRIQRGDLAVLEDMFSRACPKFINPVLPQYDDPHITQHGAMRHQLSIFMNEVKRQVQLPTIRSYLKLYSTIEVEKLAQFLEMDVDTLKLHLQCYSHKNRCVSWKEGGPLTGEWGPASNTEFYIDGDMIHVVDNKVARRYCDYFIRHINRFGDIQKNARE